MGQSFRTQYTIRQRRYKRQKSRTIGDNKGDKGGDDESNETQNRITIISPSHSQCIGLTSNHDALIYNLRTPIPNHQLRSLPH